MSELSYEPPLLPTRTTARGAPAPQSSSGFVQSITLREGTQTIGTARWHAPSSEDGVAQLLELATWPPHQRRGHGRQLLLAVIGQAREHFHSRGLKLRHMWLGVEQKSQVNARAFLTANGFHHVSTVQDLLRKQDLLIYIKSFV